MADLAAVLAAIQNLSTVIATSGSGLAKVPVSGSISLVGDCPVVTLAALADPTDSVRVGMTITVQEPYNLPIVNTEEYTTYLGRNYPCANSGGAQTTVSRVYTRHETVGVAADGVTCTLAPLPRTISNVPLHTLSGTQTGGIVHTMTARAKAAMTLTSSSLLLLTRYH